MSRYLVDFIYDSYRKLPLKTGHLWQHTVYKNGKVFLGDICVSNFLTYALTHSNAGLLSDMLLLISIQ